MVEIRQPVEEFSVRGSSVSDLARRITLLEAKVHKLEKELYSLKNNNI